MSGKSLARNAQLLPVALPKNLGLNCFTFFVPTLNTNRIVICQDVVPKSSHPSPPPVPHEDLERKRNHLSPHLDLESRQVLACNGLLLAKVMLWNKGVWYFLMLIFSCCFGILK